MKHALLPLLALALLVSACDPPGPVQGAVPIPPPASACAPVEAAPVAPVLTAEQRKAADVALVTALGPTLGVALIQFTDVSLPAWARRQAQRVEETRNRLCPETGRAPEETRPVLPG